MQNVAKIVGELADYDEVEIKPGLPKEYDTSPLLLSVGIYGPLRRHKKCFSGIRPDPKISSLQIPTL
jgi:hypothetical protein